MSAIFTARYDGQCADCLLTIHEGDTVHYVDDELMHAGCEIVDDPLPSEPACPTCFLVGPCDCEEDT